MPRFDLVREKTRETLEVYWLLARIMVPIAIITEILSRLGVIEAVAPVLKPVMGLVGLPPELGLAWLTGMLVGIWGALPLVYALVDPATLSVADITIFSSLLLFAHGLPTEQKIIQQAGPGMAATTTLRIAGALLYGAILHQVCSATGWLSEPVDPAWIPMTATTSWVEFFYGLGETMVWMLVVLVVLVIGLDLLKASGILKMIMTVLSPVLRLAGLRGEAEHLTAVGLFLGISYGAGLLIREARSGLVSPRQIFLSCVFMGFAHSVIEDTLIMIAIGADFHGVVTGRVIFAVIATAGIAGLLRFMAGRPALNRVLRHQGAEAEG